MAAKNRKIELLPKIIEMTNLGMTAKEAAEKLDVHPVTVQKWCREEGIKLKRNKTGRPKAGGPTLKGYTCDYCGASFQGRPDVPRRFCSREHASLWKSENQTATKIKICPCGKKVDRVVDGKRVYHNKKYCSTECRKLYGDYRKPDPKNHVTFICQNERCSEEVSRPKGVGYHKYCSNACAQKHTRTKKHIVVDDATVLDSKLEALVWGLFSLLGYQIERYDRNNAVEWNSGQWYAPDFLLIKKDESIALEVKGREDENDQERWRAFKDQVGPLWIITHDEMRDRLRSLKGEFLSLGTRL